MVAAVVGFLLVGGGVFLLQENQKAVASLNETLPEGVRVEKSLFGNEYKIVNKIDGYEFTVPKEWVGVQKVEYIKQDKNENKYETASIEITGVEGIGRLIGVDKFNIQEFESKNLENTAREIFEYYELTGEFSKDPVGNIEIVKTRSDTQLLGMYVYFFKTNSAIYGVTGGSEEYIRKIISSGKWQ